MGGGIGVGVWRCTFCFSRLMFGWLCAFSFEAFEHRWQHNVQHFNDHRGFVQTFGESFSSSQSPSFSSWPHFHCFHLFQCSLESWVAVWGNNMYSALTISRNLLLSTTETFLQPKWANTKNLEPIIAVVIINTFIIVIIMIIIMVITFRCHHAIFSLSRSPDRARRSTRASRSRRWWQTWCIRPGLICDHFIWHVKILFDYLIFKHLIRLSDIW